MAEENINDKDEQDDFFGDDDDFGLPDLEYEALDDDDKDDKSDAAPADEPVAETPQEEPVEETPAETTPDPEPVAESSDDPTMDDMDSDTDNIFGEDIPDDIGDEVGDDFYSEESFEDFDASDINLDEEVPDSVFDSDDFDADGDVGEDFKEFESDLGLGESDFQTSDTAASASTPSFSKDEAAASKGKFTKIVIFGTILFLGLGFGFWYAYDNGGEDEKPKQTARANQQQAKKPAAQQQRPSNTQQRPAQQQPQQQRPANNQAAQQSRPTQQQPAATPVTATPGSVTTLDARTGNAFVIVGSFVDEDIANDYANKLAAEGKSPSIIKPFGNGLFHRVAIAGFPTVAAAQQNLDNFKGEYGPDVWVLKY